MSDLTIGKSASVVLRAEGLNFGFAKQQALFKDFAVSLPPGVTWLGGDESAGKTTLLRLLAGDLPAWSGTLQVNSLTLAEDAKAYCSQVSWVDPRTQAFDSLTPLAYWDGLRKQHPSFADERLADLIVALSLEQHLTKSLYMLSTGTKRKVFLAGAFASGSAVTLLDEPFAALDKTSIALVLDLLRDAAAHPTRVWLVADYVEPSGVALAATVDLGVLRG